MLLCNAQSHDVPMHIVNALEELGFDFGSYGNRAMKNKCFYKYLIQSYSHIQYQY